MPLRNQPYLPLYVQDFLTDEKLMECSASATGIYIRLMCIMHKSDEYGVILLKQKDKQKSSSLENFAVKLARFMPYQIEEITGGLKELLDAGVIQNGDDKLMQKRMVRDNNISELRSKAGKKGGLKTQKIAKAKPKAKHENENENEIKDVIEVYNKTTFSKIEKLTDVRKSHLSARIKEYGFDIVCEVINKADKSNFLHGKNNTGWKANFDWIINPQNFIKILEGNYENKILVRELKPMMP